MQVRSLGQEEPLAEEMAICYSNLAWEEEPGGLQSMGSQRVRHDSAHTHTRAHTNTFSM